MSVSFIEFFVEEPSAEVAVRIVVPKILGVDERSFDVHSFAGKSDLLSQLPDRLNGYAHWLPTDWRIVILLDEDRQDCMRLKRKVEKMARDAGLEPKRRGQAAAFQVLTRFAIEELEAWYLGDVAALCAAYPGFPGTLHKRAAFRNADAIAGGTWERLEQVLQRIGYHEGGLAKIQLARDVTPHMDPAENRSRSFQVFRDGLRAL